LSAFELLSASPTPPDLRDRPFVCVINGNRDRYEVPLALAEAGLLTRLVTDYYAPDHPPGWLPSLLARRRRKGLPSRLVGKTPAALVVQQVGKRLPLPISHVHGWTDRILARAGLRAARQNNADLYCYSSYLPGRRAKDYSGRIIDFEYHPQSEFALPILEQDVERFPEVANSFLLEQKQLAFDRRQSGWREADAVVCASTFTRRSLEHVGCPANRVTVIPYGLDAPNPQVTRRTARGCHFLFVGQGVQRKGLHHLLRVWRDSAPPDCNLTLVCYQIDPGIRALAEKTSVTLLGRQSREELTALYRNADVFVMPSLIEGFGLAYLEALREGCHLIGSTNTGLPDLPLSSAAATVLPPGNLEALAIALARCAADKRSGQLNAVMIAQEALKWTWADFRRGIVDHARSVRHLESS
jgi:glycosyltransferase involved in cell wall biosynthesis